MVRWEEWQRWQRGGKSEVFCFFFVVFGEEGAPIIIIIIFQKNKYIYMSRIINGGVEEKDKK